jgi:hypothetical protein
MLSSNMLLLNLILLIDVTFSTPTPVNDNWLFTHDGSRKQHNEKAHSLPH